MDGVRKTITLATAADAAAVEKLTKTLQQLFTTADLAKGDVQKGVAALRGQFDSLSAGLKVAEQQMRANGVSGREFAQATIALRQAQADAKNGVESFTAAAKNEATTLGELRSIHRAARDEVGNFRIAVDQASASTQVAEQRQTSMLGSMTRLVGGITILYRAWQLLKDTISAGIDFDKNLSRVALSTAPTAGGLDAARSSLGGLAGNVASGSIFDVSQVLTAFEKLADNGADLAHMTRAQFLPVLQAATATLQDLGDVTDVVDSAMDNFNIPLAQSARIANVVTVAYHDARISAKELTDGIVAAGSAAAASGTGLESYVAVLAQLKAIGFTGTQAGQFQKRFFASLDAPNANQLAVLARRGINPYHTPEDFDPLVRGADSLTDLAGRLPGALGRGVGAIGGGLAGQATTLRANAQATQDARAELVRLADANDRAAGAVRSYGELVQGATTDLGHLKDAESLFKGQLEDTKTALQQAKNDLAAVRTEIQQLANPRLTGMDAFDDEIARIELAAKREELQLLRSADAGTAFGASLESSAKNASSLKTRLQELKSAELVGERAYNDRAFLIQQDIKRFELQKLQLAPHQLFEENALSGRIAKLQRDFQIVNLQRDLQFDPVRHQIDAAIGSGGAAMLPNDVLAEAQRIAPALASAQAREKDGNARVDALRRRAQEKTLDRDVTYGGDLLRIKEAQRTAARAAGITPNEQSAGDVLASLPTLVAHYRALNASVEDLTGREAAQAQIVRTYSAAVDGASRLLDAYKRKLDDAKTAVENLTTQQKDAEETFAGIPKTMKDEVDVLDAMATSGFSAGDAFAYMGARAGGMLVAILGPNNERVAALKEQAAALREINAATGGAAQITRTGAGQVETIQATARTAQIQVGEAIIQTAAQRAGETGPLDTLRHPIAATEQFIQDLGYLTNLHRGAAPAHFAHGGIVPGYGSGDSVLALLTPKEEVLRRDDPRHRWNGGGSVVVNISNVSVRNEGDIDLLVQKVSTKLADERRRAALGMPA